MSEKACKQCGELKDVSNFQKDKKMKDGYINQCNSCVNKRRQEKNKDNIEKVRAQNRIRDAKRNKNPERKEYVKNHRMVEKNCIHCNGSFIGNRYSNKKVCDSCVNKELEQKEINQLTEQLRKELVSLRKYTEKIIIKEKDINERKRECSECGYVFFAQHKASIYCSSKCNKKARNRNKETLKGRRGERIKSNGKIDKDISLGRLIIRDNNVCHICNEQCNVNDYTITDEGYFIVGNMYPSIDHVTAIANGGTHTWSNVSLAHMICNAIKCDKVVV